MKNQRISKEEAERLARRDRQRIIGMAVFAALVGGLYLYSANDAKTKRDAQEAEMAKVAPDRGLVEDVVVSPFDQPEILKEIRDTTHADQELLAAEPLREVFNYARIQTDIGLRAQGLVEPDSAVLRGLIDAPGEHRLDALRVRGEILHATARARTGNSGDSWMGSLLTADGDVVHFLVAAAPLQPGGERSIEAGDFLRVEGLFYGLYRTAVDLDGPGGQEAQAVTAPLVLGARASASTPRLTEEIARLAPTLAAVQDDTLGDIHEDSEFEFAKWELMGRAHLLSGETNWDEAPKLNSEILRSIYDNGDEFRGQPFRFPVSVNLEGNSYTASDNPLRIDRVSEGWIGNIVWKDPVGAVKWIAPFRRDDLLRGEIDDDNRFVTARGYFFRNEVYTTQKGIPGRAPVFVLDSIDIYTPEPDPSIAWFAYGVLGLTVLLIGVIFLLLRADKRKSAAMYEDMLRRKRARRERTQSATPA